jgi:hypothetical protein
MPAGCVKPRRASPSIGPVQSKREFQTEREQFAARPALMNASDNGRPGSDTCHTSIAKRRCITFIHSLTWG